MPLISREDSEVEYEYAEKKRDTIDIPTKYSQAVIERD